MEAIDVGKIKIEPFEFARIHDIEIKKKLNEHSTLYVYGIVRDSEKTKPVTEAKKGDSIRCKNDDQTYFDGVLQSVNINCIDEVYYLEIYAISNTILLDTVRYKRSFQDNGQTYKEIVETVIKDSGGSVTYNASEMKKVENIILQYNETDWEFAKRLASHTQDVLIPITASKPEFHFGATDSGGAKLETSSYSISKDFNAYRRMSTEDEPLDDNDDITVYTVKTNNFICDLGEKLNLNGTDLHVCRITLSLVDSSLAFLYTLASKKAISTAKYYNHAITGLVLSGKVLKVENDKVKLHIGEYKEEEFIGYEEEDEGKAHLFKYATGYSAEGHTGWYVMPEVDDTVQLHFPKEDEKYAYVAASVRWEDTDKTTDPLVKYLRTPFGKEIKLDEKEILITSKDDETFIRINEETGIEIITSKPIRVTSGDAIDIVSEGDMSISTNKNLAIAAEESIEISCKGNVVKIEPSSGIAVSTDKKFELLSEDNATIDGKKEISIKSGKDMKVQAGSKLVESAQSAVEMSSSGSSIKLDGNVDIKGKMIKEN